MHVMMYFSAAKTNTTVHHPADMAKAVRADRRTAQNPRLAFGSTVAGNKTRVARALNFASRTPDKTQTRAV